MEWRELQSLCALLETPPVVPNQVAAILRRMVNCNAFQFAAFPGPVSLDSVAIAAKVQRGGMYDDWVDPAARFVTRVASDTGKRPEQRLVLTRKLAPAVTTGDALAAARIRRLSAITGPSPAETTARVDDVMVRCLRLWDPVSRPQVFVSRFRLRCYPQQLLHCQTVAVMKLLSLLSAPYVSRPDHLKPRRLCNFRSCRSFCCF